MSTKTRSTEVDEATATALEVRADERGLTVPDLLAEIASEAHVPLEVAEDQIIELDRRWLAVQGRALTVPHDQVVRWLQTWGTPAFKPWRDRGAVEKFRSHFRG